MALRRLAAIVVFLAASGSWVGASDTFQTAVSVDLSAPSENPSPWIHPKLSPRIRLKIETSFELAIRHVRQEPECRALFDDLGSDGVEMLRTALYFPMPNTLDGFAICKRAEAATLVGAAATFICRGFDRLSDENAALVLIHEALHHAGLTEHPQDPNGMTSAEINRMVERSCCR